MSNLKKGSSHDFDLLAENKGIDMGDSENLTLVLAKFSPYPITIEILPIEGRIRARIYYRELSQYLTFEIPLGLHREMEIPMLWSLGLLRKQGLDLEIPLARIVTQILEMIMPIHAKIAKLKILVSEVGEVQYSVNFEGKPEVKAGSLEELRELLKEGN